MEHWITWYRVKGIDTQGRRMIYGESTIKQAAELLLEEAKHVGWKGLEVEVIQKPNY